MKKYELVENIITTVEESSIMTTENFNFLRKNKDHLNKVIDKTFMWRTTTQKLSIISDEFFPTTHSKFHQAILEQKVQFDQTMLLAKDFELKKLDIEEKQLKIDSIDNSKLGIIKVKKLQIKIHFLEYELQQMKIAMNYRMSELKGWQKIQENLMNDLKSLGMSDNDIWDKEVDEGRNFFYASLNNLQGAKVTKDPAELQNLIGLAKSSIEMAIKSGNFEKWADCATDIQRDSLGLLGYTQK